MPARLLFEVLEAGCWSSAGCATPATDALFLMGKAQVSPQLHIKTAGEAFQGRRNESRLSLEKRLWLTEALCGHRWTPAGTSGSPLKTVKGTSLHTKPPPGRRHEPRAFGARNSHRMPCAYHVNLSGWFWVRFC
ncbi:hypothetical protein PAL_GLEAN10002342 [Pteropus alecto]|uniref:Uncharacterized protein n=1 Tax=Pteropus alecto TaxID=9402 RepID=L5KBF3_PTEAL|nr:hypothetical protein PAL_GLEAN10002342 [Pteropus alecto]